MTYYLGITDTHWFRFLAQRANEDVNFWKPSGGSNFKALTPGAPFLFKLKAPINKVGGVGFFSSFTHLPLSIAWEVFEERNGVASYVDFRLPIVEYGSTALPAYCGTHATAQSLFFIEKRGDELI